MTKDWIKAKLAPYSKDYDIHYDEISENDRYILVGVNKRFEGPLCIDKETGKVITPGTVLTWFFEAEAQYGEFKPVNL